MWVPFLCFTQKASTLHLCQVTKTEKLPCKAELLQIKGRKHTKLWPQYSLSWGNYGWSSKIQKKLIVKYLFKPSAFIRQSRSLWNHKAEPHYLKPPCSCSKNSGGKSSFSAMIHLSLSRSQWLAQGQSHISVTSVPHWCHIGVTSVSHQPVMAPAQRDSHKPHTAAVPGAVWLQQGLALARQSYHSGTLQEKGP